MPGSLADDGFNWQGPASQARKSILQLARELFIPPKGHKVVPTASGLFLIFVGLCLGLAAYNTENNILFAAFSILLATIVLSGVASWVNLSSARWRLHTSRTLRVDEEGEVGLVVENARRRFPLYCIFFELESSADGSTKRLYLENSLDVGEETKLTWSYVPQRRCRATIFMRDAQSTFPFGFLRKHVGGDCRVEVCVWPRRIKYQRCQGVSAGRIWEGQSTKTRGQSGELLGLRQYVRGDAPRSIHWKVSAKQGRLMVKENAIENQPLYAMLVDPSRYLWNDTEQFEAMCSLAVTLAEDLFLSGKLHSATIAGHDRLLINRVSDLETFFDMVSGLEPEDAGGDGNGGRAGGVPSLNRIDFKPLGGLLVGAFVHGTKIAQT